MNVKEALEQYKKWDWNIIPLAKNSKEPIKGLKLERWFNEKYPSDNISSDLNIGVITGKTSNIAVIDIDDESKVQGYITKFPTEVIQKTPHGIHLFYHWNPKLPAVKKIDGGDFFNGNHYVVIAPSKVDNLQYEWLSQGSFGTLPDSVFEKETAKIQIQSGKYSRQEIYELINYALENSKPLEGSGNDTILYGSMVLAGDGWTKPALLSLMRNLNQARDNPESDKIVESMVDRAIEYAKNNKKPEPVKQTTNKPTEFKVLPYSAMIDKYADYSADWLVEGWLPKASVIMCSALPEMYKTWLSIDLAISVASGLPFLDVFPVDHTGNVLIVQQEDFGPEFISRFKTVERGKLARANIEVKITENEGTFDYENPYYIGDKIFFHEDAELSFQNDESLTKLGERIVETNATLCVIDPFYSLADSKDWFASAAETIRATIKKIRNETDCTFVFIHHNKKTGAGGDDRGQIYGSTLLNAALEGTWGVTRSAEMGATEVVVYKHFKTKKPELPTHIKYHIDMYAEIDSEAYYPEVEEISSDIRMLIMDYLVDNGPTGFSELFDVFSDQVKSKTTFSKIIKSMVGNGISQNGTKGKYSIEPDAG